MIKIKLVRSPIGRTNKHKDTIKALGLKKINQEVELPDTPQTRGMIARVDYMLEIVE